MDNTVINLAGQPQQPSQPTTYTSDQLNYTADYSKVGKRLEGGEIRGTTTGGYLQPIFYQFIPAGFKTTRFGLENQVYRVLAPKVATTDKLYATIRVGAVPLSYMVNGYDEKRAARLDASDPGNLPDISLPTLTFASTNAGGTHGGMQNFVQWKNKVASFYLPNQLQGYMPVSILPIRAYTALYNAFVRNKLYVPPLTEFTDASVTSTEAALIRGTFVSPDLPVAFSYDHGTIVRDMKRDSYYTRINPTLLAPVNALVPGGGNIGGDSMLTAGAGDNIPIANPQEFHSAVGLDDVVTAITYQDIFSQSAHIDWQSSIAEFRRRVLQAPLNDWDCIAMLGGCAAVRTDRPVQLCPPRSIPLNYMQATQTAPSTGSGVTPLGTTGSFSVTMPEDIDLFGAVEFLQDSVLIMTLTIQSETFYEEAIHRTALIRDTTDIYNPDISHMNIDYLSKLEVNGTYIGGGSSSAYLSAYKRKYSEWEVMPNLCLRDARSISLWDYNASANTTSSLAAWHTMISTGVNPSGTAFPVVGQMTYFQDSTDGIIARNSQVSVSPFIWTDQVLFAMNVRHFAVIPAPKRITERGQDRPR